jgi:hypothetical protein
MNARLHHLLAEAESLPEAEQDLLADLVESFMASHAGSDLFTPEELEHIRRLESEPFVEADPDEVAAFFARRG